MPNRVRTDLDDPTRRDALGHVTERLRDRDLTGLSTPTLILIGHLLDQAPARELSGGVLGGEHGRAGLRVVR